MVTDLSIATSALRLLGTNGITSFEDGSSEAVIASSLYDSTYESMLTSYPWRFASKKAQLSRLSATPQNEYLYQYQLPADLIYLQHVIDTRDFEIYGDKLYSNNTEEYIDYTYKVDVSMLPSYYSKALEFLLAAQFAIPITSDKDLSKLYYGMYKDQLSKAKFADSSQRPTITDDYSEYIAVRN